MMKNNKFIRKLLSVLISLMMFLSVSAEAANGAAEFVNSGEMSRTADLVSNKIKEIKCLLIIH